MLHSRRIFLFVFLFLFAIGGSARAYDTETHAYLTDEVINFYNKNFTNTPVQSNLRNYLIDGSRREDDVPRWMNHFYDPVNNVGLHDPFIGEWEKSKDWANDSENQNNLKYRVPAVVASILSAIEKGKISDISSETDFTWHKALVYYVAGEKEKASFLLGHIIHLIEDASVPDHTRNDPHAAGSPYESWTDQFKLQNKDPDLSVRLPSSPPIQLNSLGSYFDGLGNYSNNNFYSKDTIGVEDYKSPALDYVKKLGGYYYAFKEDVNTGDYPLFVYKTYPKGLIFSNNDAIAIQLTDEDEVVHSYWSRLSTKAVQYGAGVIDLFFREAERAKNDPNFNKEEPKSFVASALDVVHNFTSAVGGAFQRAASIAGDAMENLFGGASIPPSENVNASPLSPPPDTSASIPPVLSEVPAMGGLSPEVEESLAGVDETARLREIQSQLDDIADLIDDLTFRVAAVTGHPAVGGVPNIVFPTQASLLSPQVAQDTSAVLLAATVSGGSGGGSGGSGGGGVGATAPSLIITEIMYNASGTDDNREWIEIKNNGTSAASLGDVKFLEGGTNHSLTFARGSAAIPAGAYAVIADDDNQFLVDYPTFSGTLFDSSFSLSNSGETISLRYGDTILDAVTYSSSTGARGDGDSLQLIGGVWVAAPPTPGSVNAARGNQTPQARFVLSASAPQVGDVVRFDASSSTDPDGSIVSYGWDFGDGQNTSSTQATSTHSYLAVGNYTVQLVVFDNNNSSSTISSILSVASSTSPNRTPNASFVYTPENPKVGDVITFNAASSTDDGAIISYQWDFGDPSAGSGQATSTILTATTTHTYSQAGSYQTSLIVFDNQSASSTATSTIISVASSTSQLSQANHIVISEIQVGGVDAGDEFIELWNPSISTVDLSAWSLQYASASTTAFNSTTIDKKEFTTTSTIGAQGFYLVARRTNAGTDGYRGSVPPDMTHRSISLSRNGGKIFLVRNGDFIGGLEDPDIVDMVDYEQLLPSGGQSIERRAWRDSVCVSALPSAAGEFLGNGCDTDTATDFEIRAAPNPQNIASFPEPRAAPTTPTALNASSGITTYSSSSLTVSFAWQPSADFSGATSTVHYELHGVSDAASSTLLFSTTSTAYSYRIAEVGRGYAYVLQAFDRDGLSSATATVTIAVPSFLDNLYFYRDPRAPATSYLVDLYYPRYPFIPQLWSSGGAWRMAVLYLNRGAPAEEYLMIGERWALDPTLLAQMVNLQFRNCAMTPDARDTFLVFPDTAAQCQYAGPLSGDISSDVLEDRHVLFTLAPPTSDANFTSSTDYLTAAFYDFWPYNVPRTFRLAAVDKIKYYFRDALPPHVAPVMNASTTVDFDEANSRIVVRWEAATDIDTLDNQLSYEVNFTPVPPGATASSTTLDDAHWESAGRQPSAQIDDQTFVSYRFVRTISPGDAFAIGVRTRDEFGNLSNVAATSWVHPPTVPSVGAAVSQIVDNVTSYHGASNSIQTLGVLSGTLTSLDIRYYPSNGPCGYSIWIREYNAPITTDDMSAGWYSPTLTRTYQGGTKTCQVFGGTTKSDTWLASDFGTPIVFSPDKYYLLFFYQLGDRFFGAGYDAFVEGEFYPTSGGSYFADPYVKDIYFVLNGADFPPHTLSP